VSSPVQLMLLTQDNCGLCDHAKQILQRVGQQYRLQITEINLTSAEGRRLAHDAGVLFAPGLLVDGEPFSFGRLSERKLRRALNQRAPDNLRRP
jgi:hypothetical protein